MFDTVLTIVAGLAGFSAVFALLINVFKWLGWIRDGDSARYLMAANLVLVLVVYALKLFKPEFDIGVVDSVLAEAATVGVYIFSFIVQIFAGKATNSIVRGQVPILGFSYSLKKAAESET